MEHKETSSFNALPIHKEDNRLAKRLFALEQRVEDLEKYVDELSEKIDFIMAFQAFKDDESGGITFCTCDEDEN